MPHIINLKYVTKTCFMQDWRILEIAMLNEMDMRCLKTHIMKRTKTEANQYLRITIRNDRYERDNIQQGLF
jgi:hypothetical protein